MTFPRDHVSNHSIPEDHSIRSVAMVSAIMTFAAFGALVAVL